MFTVKHKISHFDRNLSCMSLCSNHNLNFFLGELLWSGAHRLYGSHQGFIFNIWLRWMHAVRMKVSATAAESPGNHNTCHFHVKKNIKGIVLPVNENCHLLTFVFQPILFSKILGRIFELLYLYYGCLNWMFIHTVRLQKRHSCSKDSFIDCNLSHLRLMYS